MHAFFLTAAFLSGWHRRDEEAYKPSRPWAHTPGFFYGERLEDREIPAPAPAPAPTRDTLLASPRAYGPGASVSTVRASPAFEPLETGFTTFEGSWPKGGGSGKHARWLLPRYLNLPAPHTSLLRGTPTPRKEEKFLSLPQPWGPKVMGTEDGTADGISKRWPVMMGA